ncbi:MAG: hypothetical protein JWQ39_99 [Glaciihabitans sp.]|jgi:uncharacterized membrane protein YhaH (DUF805 family)|nr:hypothetical protein [Glaciihabitans sp.]
MIQVIMSVQTTVFGWIAGSYIVLIVIAGLHLLLAIVLIVQIIASGFSRVAKAAWIVLAALIPLVGLIGWFFYGPRQAATAEERETAENWLAEATADR